MKNLKEAIAKAKKSESVMGPNMQKALTDLVSDLKDKNMDKSLVMDAIAYIVDKAIEVHGGSIRNDVVRLMGSM